MSRPLVFRLLPTPWVAIWEAEGEVRGATKDLRTDGAECPDQERALALIEACADELCGMWQPHQREVVGEAAEFARAAAYDAFHSDLYLECDPERGFYAETEDGHLFMKYADSTSSERPYWYPSRRLG